MTSLENRMHDANPIPEARAEFGDDEIAALLTLTRARSGDMDIKEMTTPVTPEKERGRGWLVAVAAAVVVLIVGGAFVMLNRGGNTVAPASTPSTTADVLPSTTIDASRPAVPELDVEAAAVVEGMVADINAGDVDAAVAPILAAGEVVSAAIGEQFDMRETVAGKWGYWAEIDSTVELLGCTTLTSGTTRCEIARSSAFDYSSPDPELSMVQLRLNDGRVAFMRHEPITGAWNTRELAFGNWALENHRDAFRFMFVDFSDPQRSADLMREYYPLWLEEEGS